ncbi:MAG: hypothetical protein SOW55_01040 [Bacilli bacterium]|nr:hypothetical protein [Bacilli bacterium]
MNNLAEKKFILLNEDTIEIDLDSSSSYKLDFKSIKYKNLVVNLKKQSKISILNVVNDSNKNVTFNL